MNSINTLYPILFNARIISPLNTIINHTILRILLFLLHRCIYIYLSQFQVSRFNTWIQNKTHAKLRNDRIATK